MTEEGKKCVIIWSVCLKRYMMIYEREKLVRIYMYITIYLFSFYYEYSGDI